MNEERYNELTILRENGELAKPENRSKFDELQAFERQARKILLIYVLNDASGKTIAESMQTIEKFTPEQQIYFAIKNQAIKPNKEAKAYLKAVGIL